MNRVTASLADGRELFYFDERPLEHVMTDSRQLGAKATSSEMRFDVLRDEWVTIASHRQDRTFLPPPDQCPLCPSRDGKQTEIPSPDYDVVVFENRFPSLSLAAGDIDPLAPGGQDLFPRRPGRGRCEVVCFTSDHNKSFTQLEPARVRTVVDAWANRTAELSALSDVEQIFPFENRGREIGVTLGHPHGQIYAYPFITPTTRRMLDSARAHREHTGRNLFADVLAAEQAAQVRIVVESDHWTAFVPVAARWPVEVHLYPHRQVPDLPELSDAERDDFARIYLEVLRRLDGLHGVPMPYVSGWHQAPTRHDRDLGYLHLELFSIRRAPDKLKYLAGSESGMNAFVNDLTPEQIAQALRDVTPPPTTG